MEANSYFRAGLPACYNSEQHVLFPDVGSHFPLCEEQRLRMFLISVGPFCNLGLVLPPVNSPNMPSELCTDSSVTSALPRQLFTDIISNDEMCSDGYEMKLVDDVVYEVDAAKIVVSDGDVDIGANPSAEEAAEALENGAEQVINIVHSFRLQSTQFDKKSYLGYLKGYMKAVKAKLAESNPDRVPEFEKGAAAFAKKIVGSFNDWEFYTGESMDPEGMVALLNYREDGVTPYLVFWKDGLRETKI